MENLPGLSNNERRYFLGISKGKVTYRPGNGQPVQSYDHFEGVLENITKREAVINGSSQIFYDFALKNVNSYVLSVPMGSSVASNIILALASVSELKGKTVKFVPYLKVKGDKSFTNVTMYVNGEKASWVVEKLPEVKMVNVGSKVVPDDAERIAAVESYVSVINDRLQKIEDPESGEFNSPVVDFDGNEEFPDRLG